MKIPTSSTPSIDATPDNSASVPSAVPSAEPLSPGQCLVEQNDDTAIAFAIKLGRALHEYGTPTYRLEAAMAAVVERFGLTGQFFAIPTGIFASFGAPEEQRTALIRVQPS